MTSNFHHSETLVEIFNTKSAAVAAVAELKNVGFTDSQITLEPRFNDVDPHSTEEIGGCAMAGAAAGLSLGALWGLGILVGIAPDIPSSFIVGFPGVVLSTAAAGAAIAGTSGAVLDTLHPHELGSDQKQTVSQYTVVTVKAGYRADIASRVLNRFNGSGHTPSQAM